MLFVVAACAPLAQDVPASIDAPQRTGTTALAGSAPRILMDEHFAHMWPADPQGTAWTGSGGYRLAARVPGQFVAVRAPLTDVPDEIVVTASFRKTGGPSGGGYGLILRDQWTSAGDGVDQSGQYIVAEVNDTGQFGIWRRNADRWAELQPWTPSTAVRPDAGVNELTAQLLGERMSFLVNGTVVANVVLGLPAGGVGMFVGGDFNEVLVDQFRVQVPGHPADLSVAPARPVAPAAPVGQVVAPATRPVTSPPRPPINLGGAQQTVAEAQQVRDLAAGLTDDVGSLMDTFSDGFDSPHSPVNDPIALKQATARLEAATSKANQLLTELQTIKSGVDDGGR
jgi:hypothetical protein